MSKKSSSSSAESTAKKKKKKKKKKKTSNILQTPDSQPTTSQPSSSDPPLNHTPASHSLPSTTTKSKNNKKKKTKTPTPPENKPKTEHPPPPPFSCTNKLKKQNESKPSTPQPLPAATIRKTNKASNKSGPPLAQPISLSVKPVIAKKKKPTRTGPAQTPQQLSLPQTPRFETPTKNQPNKAKPAQSNVSTTSHSFNTQPPPPTPSQTSLQTTTPQTKNKQKKKKKSRAPDPPTIPRSLTTPTHNPANTQERSPVATPASKNMSKKKKQNISEPQTPGDSRCTQAPESPLAKQPPKTTVSSTKKAKKRKKDTSQSTVPLQHQASDTVAPSTKKKKKKKKDTPQSTVPLQQQAFDATTPLTKKKKKKNAPQSTLPLSNQACTTAAPSTQTKTKKKKKQSSAQSIPEATAARLYPAVHASLTAPPSSDNKQNTQKAPSCQPSFIQRPLQGETPHPSAPQSSSQKLASAGKKQLTEQRTNSLGSESTKTPTSQQSTAEQCRDLCGTQHSTPAPVTRPRESTCAQHLPLRQRNSPTTLQVPNPESSSKKTTDTQPTATLRRSARLQHLTLMKSMPQTGQETVAGIRSPGTLRASPVQSNSNGVANRVTSGQRPAREWILSPRCKELEIHKNQLTQTAQKDGKSLEKAPAENHKTLVPQARSRQPFHAMGPSCNGAQPLNCGDRQQPLASTIRDSRKDRNYMTEQQMQRDPTPALSARVEPKYIGNPEKQPYNRRSDNPVLGHMVPTMRNSLGWARKSNGPSYSNNTQPSSSLMLHDAEGSNTTPAKQKYLSRKRSNGIIGSQSPQPPKRARYSQSRQPSRDGSLTPQASAKVNVAEHYMSSEQGRYEPRSSVTLQTSTQVNGAVPQVLPKGARYESRRNPSSQGLNVRIPDNGQRPQPNLQEAKAPVFPTNRPQNYRNRHQDSPVTEGRRPVHRTPARRKSLQTKTVSPTGEYFGIRYGREGFSGVITNWTCCSQFVIGYCGAVYAIFDTWEKAEEFADRHGTGASLKHRHNVRHFFGRRRNGTFEPGSIAQLPWELENEPKVVSLVTGAAWHLFGMGAGLGGYGVFLSEHSPYNFAGVMEGHVTEMRLYLKAALEALEIVHQHGLVVDGGVVELYTVSEEVKNGLDHWLGRWDRTGKWTRYGREVGNQDLWKAILWVREELKKKGTRIHMIWVRGPGNVPAMQRARSLARQSFSHMLNGEQGSFPQASIP